MQTIPPTELVKYLNQVDLRALVLTCKLFNRLYGFYQNKVKERFDTSATLYIFCIYPKSELLIIKYKGAVRSELPKTHHTFGEIINYFTPYKIFINEIIEREHLKVEHNDIIQLKLSTNVCHEFMIGIYESERYIQKFDRYIYYSGVSINHWSYIFDIYKLVIMGDQYLIHHDYIEIKEGDFLFRIPCLKNVLVDKTILKGEHYDRSIYIELCRLHSNTIYRYAVKRMSILSLFTK